MKRIFYIGLMIVFFVMISVSLYFCSIYISVYHGLVPRREIIAFTDMMLSREAFGLVAIIGSLLGLRFGKRWWQIIYVDGVYYFGKSREKTKRKRVVRKTREEEK